ncbi:MAG: response regulator transcription factor [Actinomycetota bacterium]|nr:response regulator transcription factor [Actinomycetota bacterium]
MKVLVVDDDESIRAAVEFVLNLDAGSIEVRVAGGGPDALEIVKTFDADVVLMDYWMPEMDGEQAAHALRAELPSARIVAYSALLSEKPQWADGFILKDRLPAAEELLALA